MMESFEHNCLDQPILEEGNMSKKRLFWVALGLLIVATMIVSACGSTTTTTAAGGATTTAGGTATTLKAVGSVGVVLPTKNEPRWIQDETRFKDAFASRRRRCPDPVQPGRFGHGESTTSSL